MKKDIEQQHHQTFEEIKQIDYYTDKETAMFTLVQTGKKLKRENIQGKIKVNQTYYDVDKKVRKTIKELARTMHEDLPIPKKSVSKIEKSMKNLEDKNYE